MAALVSTENSLFFLLVYVIISVSATNNTTQFGNFTIEWEDFSLFNCSEPASYSFSRFTCLPRAGYAIVEDISCLVETTISFDQSTCQATTVTSMLTSTNLMTTQTNTVRQTQTSVSTGTATTRITTVRTDTTGGSSSSTTFASSTSTSTGQVNTTAHTGNTTSTTVNVFSTNTTVTPEVITMTTSATANASVSTSSTSASTSTSAGQIFNCNETYIGVFCNVSSDPCAMSQPCLNAATCFPNNSLPFGYRCQCRDGFIGYNCQWDEHSCLFDTCWHNGTCIPVNSSIPSYNGSNFRCECIQGYNGVFCELKIDLCDDITCENRGMCQTIENDWECRCLDPTLYSGEYCQIKSGALRLREILSKSFAAVAIGAIVTTCSFVIVMDVLKYAFHIDPVECERDSYRRRCELRRQARQPPRTDHPKIALRFQYVT